MNAINAQPYGLTVAFDCNRALKFLTMELHIENSGLNWIQVAKIKGQIFNLMPDIDSTLKRLETVLYLDIQTGYVKIGRGGSHIWIADRFNNRMAIIK